MPARSLSVLFLWLALAGPVSVQTRFHHVHLNSVDPRAAIEFYMSHLSGEKGAA
jgi:hypothetical protein